MPLHSPLVGPRMRVSLVSPAIFMLLLAAGVLAGCGRGGTQETPIVFGVAAPLQETYGKTARMGAELAQREINAGSGLNGRRLELRFIDDGGLEQTAFAAAEELFANDSIVAVVGNVTSTPTIGAAKVYARGLPALATSATSREISKVGEWVFRIAPSDSAIATSLAARARQLEARVAVLYSNEKYGRGLTRDFQRAFEVAGGQIISIDPYLEEMQDFTPYLKRLQRERVGLVMVAGVETGASHIIAQARQMGYNARFIGGDGLEALREMGPVYDGAMVGMLFHEAASPAASDFSKRFREAYKREPDSSAATAYDAVLLLASAVQAGNTSRASIRDYLAQVGASNGAPAFEGVTGRIEFDQNGDPLNKPFVIGVVQNGELALLSGGK